MDGRPADIDDGIRGGQSSLASPSNKICSILASSAVSPPVEHYGSCTFERRIASLNVVSAFVILASIFDNARDVECDAAVLIRAADAFIQQYNLYTERPRSSAAKRATVTTPLHEAVDVSGFRILNYEIVSPPLSSIAGL
jgi:hypothetical protein